MANATQFLRQGPYYETSRELKSFDVHPHYPWLVTFYSDGTFDYCSYTATSVDVIAKGNISNTETQGAKVKIGKPTKVFFYDAHTAKHRQGIVQLQPQALEDAGSSNTGSVSERSERDGKSEREGTVSYSNASWTGTNGVLEQPVDETLILFLTDSQLLCYDHRRQSWRTIDFATQLEKPALSICFFAYRNQFAFGCSDGSVRVWDVQTWSRSCVLKTSNPSKPIFDILTTTYKGTVFVLTFQTDLVISVFDFGHCNQTVTQPYLVLTSKSLLEKSEDRLINSVFIHPLNGHIYVLTESSIVVLNNITAKVICKYPFRNSLNCTPILHPAFDFGSVMLLSSTTPQVSVINPHLASARPMRFFNLELLRLTVDKFVSLIPHPTNPYLLFASTDQGIFLLNIIMPLRRHVSLQFTNEETHVSRTAMLLQSGTGLAEYDCLKSIRRDIPELVTCCNTSSFLMASPSGKYLIVFSYFERIYKVYEIATWKELVTSAAESIAWCSFKDTFAVIEHSVPIENYQTSSLKDRKLKSDKKVNLISKDDPQAIKVNKRKSQGRMNRRLSLPMGGADREEWAKEQKEKEAKERKERRTQVSDTSLGDGDSPSTTSSKTKAEIVLFEVAPNDMLGFSTVVKVGTKALPHLVPLHLVGGPVLGLYFVRPTTGTSTSGGSRLTPSHTNSAGAEKKAQEKRSRAGLFQFYSWNSLSSIMSSFMSPDLVLWDPRHQYCLFIYPDFATLFSISPQWEQIKTINLSIQSACWNNNTLILVSGDMVYFCFPREKTAHHDWLVSITLAFSSVELASYSPAEKFFFGGSQPVGVYHGKLALLRGERIHLVSLSVLNRFGLLVQADLTAEAIKWTFLMNEQYAEEALLVFLNNQQYAEALSSNISLASKIDICFKFNLLKVLQGLLPSYLDQLLAKGTVNDAERLKRNCLSLISAYDQMDPNKEYQASILAIFNEVKRIYPNAYYLWRGMEDSSSPRSLITSKTERDGKCTDSLSHPLPRSTYPLPPVKFPAFANGPTSQSSSPLQHVRPTFTLPELTRELAPQSVFALDSSRQSPQCYVYNDNNELLVTSDHMKRMQDTFDVLTKLPSNVMGQLYSINYPHLSEPAMKKMEEAQLKKYITSNSKRRASFTINQIQIEQKAVEAKLMLLESTPRVNVFKSEMELLRTENRAVRSTSAKGLTTQRKGSTASLSLKSVC